MKKEQSSKKHPITLSRGLHPGQSRTKELAEPSKHLPIKWRKELSSWARLLIFGVYGLVCFSIGKKLMDQSAPFKKLEEKTAELSKKLDALAAKREALALAPSHANLSQSQIDHIGRKIKMELSELYSARENADAKTIAAQKKRIAELELHLTNLLEGEAAASSELHVASTTSVPYNRKNLDILYYTQRLRKERLREQLKKEREAFVVLHDMQVWDNQKKFENLQDEHKLILYRLDKDFEKERSEFRERGHRAPASL